MKKTILFVCPFFRDEREISRLGIQKKYNIIFDEYTKKWHGTLFANNVISLQQVMDSLDYFDDEYDGVTLDGIVASRDYPGCILSSILGQRWGLPAPNPELILRCEHKYLSRLDQRNIVPEAVPKFYLIDPLDKKTHHIPQDLFPFFLKPVKATFSMNAFKIHDKDEMNKAIYYAPLSSSMMAPFDFFLDRLGLSSACHSRCLITEEYIQGFQTTLEGFVHNGQVNILGIVDSIMHSNAISFERFEYPSSLSHNIQQRMKDIAKRFIQGIGFDNSLFNIEFMYNENQDTLHIIEINPRLSTQFADLFERVDGINTYEVMLDLAVGCNPLQKKRSGSFEVAGILVLRFFEDKRVLKVPSQNNIQEITSMFPDARIEVYARKGKKLSDEIQDSYSFRYCTIHLGARNHENLLQRFEKCKKLLDFEFNAVN